MEIVILSGLAIIGHSLSNSKKLNEPNKTVKEVMTTVKNKYPIKDDDANLEMNIGDVPMPKKGHSRQLNFVDGVSTSNQKQDTWATNAAWGNDLDNFQTQYQLLDHEPDSYNKDGLYGKDGTGYGHNNMVPYFGSKRKQNTNTDLKERRLETFTGVDNTDFVKKKESENLFKPEKQNIFGSHFNVNKDNYVVSDKMNNVTPVEKQYVGPGIGIGPEVSAKGGFHDTFRILPDHLNSYKKQTFKGRVVAGKTLNSGPQSAPTVAKRKPDRFYTLEDRENVASSFFVSAPKDTTQNPIREGRNTTELTTGADLTVLTGHASQAAEGHMAREDVSKYQLHKNDMNCGRNLVGPQAHEATGGGYNVSQFIVNETMRENCRPQTNVYRPQGPNAIKLADRNQQANMTIREGTSTCYNGPAQSYLPGNMNQLATDNAEPYYLREETTRDYTPGPGRTNIRAHAEDLEIAEFKPDYNREVIKNPNIWKTGPEANKIGSVDTGTRPNDVLNTRFMPNLARNQLKDNSLVNLPVKYGKNQAKLSNFA